MHHKDTKISNLTAEDAKKNIKNFAFSAVEITDSTEKDLLPQRDQEHEGHKEKHLNSAFSAVKIVFVVK